MLYFHHHNSSFFSFDTNSHYSLNLPNITSLSSGSMFLVTNSATFCPSLKICSLLRILFPLHLSYTDGLISLTPHTSQGKEVVSAFFYKHSCISRNCYFTHLKTLFLKVWDLQAICPHYHHLFTATFDQAH